jgi:hypothetical protein
MFFFKIPLFYEREFIPQFLLVWAKSVSFTRFFPIVQYEIGSTIQYQTTGEKTKMPYNQYFLVMIVRIVNY